MRALTAVLLVSVLGLGCAAPDRARSTVRRPATTVKKVGTTGSTVAKTTVKTKKRAKKAEPQLAKVEPSPASATAPVAYQPMRVDVVYSGLMNDALHLEGVAHPVTVERGSREKLAGLRRGDRVTLLFAPGHLAQVVETARVAKPAAEPPAAPSRFDGIEKGDRVQLHIAGGAWVTGEVAALEPRVMIDFSHEHNAFVGQCSYEPATVEEIHRMPSLDTGERLHNRLVNARGHGAGEAPVARAISPRGKAVAAAGSNRARAARTSAR